MRVDGAAGLEREGILCRQDDFFALQGMTGVVGQRYFFRPDLECGACADGIATASRVPPMNRLAAPMLLSVVTAMRVASGSTPGAGNRLAGDDDFRRADVHRRPSASRSRRKFVNGIEL